MSGPRRKISDASQPDDPNAAVLAELRTMNRLLAAFTTRELPRAEAMAFLAAAGFSATQIAEVLGLNPAAVRMALLRARRAADAEASATADGNGARRRAAGTVSEEGDADGDA